MGLLLGDHELDLRDRVLVVAEADGGLRTVPAPGEPDAAVAWARVGTDRVEDVAAALAADPGRPVIWSPVEPVDDGWADDADHRLAAVGAERRRVALDDRCDLIDASTASARLAGRSVPVPEPTASADGAYRALNLTGAELPEAVALLTLGLVAGRRVVVTDDPEGAHRCLAVLEALHRERVGRFR